MANKINDLREELKSLKLKSGLRQQIDCSEEDTKKYQQMAKDGEPLPDGVYQYKDDFGDGPRFYTLYETDLTEKEMLEYFIIKQSLHIQTIKNCVIFITLVVALYLLLSLPILANIFLG